MTDFISEWNSAQPTVKVRTSGSTGIPKEMLVEKRRMEASARMTCDFLGLTPADKALLCLPTDYIAGKMMVVRSLVSGMPLISVPPSSRPLAGLTQQPDFVAMTPMQVVNTLKSPDEMAVFCRIRNVIIGGSAIDSSLEQRLKTCPNAVWSTYGMTETLSHIALRRVSGKDSSLWYTPMQGVTVALSADSTLRIDAPLLYDGILLTTDIAEINSLGQFRILGRKDNVINSGGVKIQIEEVEARLKEVLDFPFMITSSPDSLLGEAVTILLPKSFAHSYNNVMSEVLTLLPQYWRPRKTLFLDSLPLTANGKPDRAAAKKLVEIL